MATFTQSQSSTVQSSSNANRRAYEKLLEIQSRGYSIPNLYLEVTKSVKKVFNEIYRVDSDNNIIGIKLIYANPERSVAKQVQEDNIILPIISFDQGISNSDQNRGKNSSLLVHEKYWDDKKQRAIRVLSLCPTPVNIVYKIHIWAKYAEDLDQIIEQISLMFNPSLNIPNKFYEATQAFITDEVDDTDYPYNDGHDRVLRRTIELKVETYLPSPKVLLTSTGAIEYTPHLEIDITTLC
tara:strand:- start:6960 stop:7676 length:717 start_codon:yes stop_codon:yes gene_type:complete